jgi:hypothetical protein
MTQAQAAVLGRGLVACSSARGLVACIAHRAIGVSEHDAGDVVVAIGLVLMLQGAHSDQ